MTTFEDAKVGDRVWCAYYGWQRITSINKGAEYPLVINKYATYTYDGRMTIGHNRTLFWDEVVITPPEKPLPKLEVDTKVLVWDIDKLTKQRRYFSHFDKIGRICVFEHGGTSWSTESTIRYLNWEPEGNYNCK